MRNPHHALYLMAGLTVLTSTHRLGQAACDV